MRKANLSLESQCAQQPDGQRGLRAHMKKLNAATRDGTKGMLSQHIDRVPTSSCASAPSDAYSASRVPEVQRLPAATSFLGPSCFGKCGVP
jgi:hypothetical protein